MNKRKARVDKMVAEGKRLSDAGITNTVVAEELGRKISRNMLMVMGTTIIGGAMANPIIVLGGMATTAVLSVKATSDASKDVGRLNAYENHIHGKSAIRVRFI